MAADIHAPYDCGWESFELFANVSGISDVQRVMFGYIYELDAAVGRVVATLEAMDLMSNTVIVFVSDNGAPDAAGVEDRNTPLRGFKSQVWEGGARVPAFVIAPGRVPPGGRSLANMHVTDWRPTLEAIAGAAITPGMDGQVMWDALVNGTQVRVEIPVNINPLCDGGQFGNPKAALILGQYKLVCWCYSIAGINNATTTGCLGDPSNPGVWPMLFDIQADPSETINLAKSQPDTLHMVERRLATIASESVEPMQWDPPYQGPNYACASCPKHPQTGNPFAPWQAWLS